MQLVLENLTKKYGSNYAVFKENLVLENGIYGLLGVNGAGKSTLINMICTLIKPNSGKIYFNGKDIYKLDDKYREIIGYLPQHFGYYPNLTVYEYMMYISSLKGLDKTVGNERTNRLLNKFGFKNEKNKKMKNLSGGMLRRVGIAQSMINNPKILVLDEPTVGLDPNERIRFRNIISEISKDRIILLSTHIVSDIEFLADHIIMMNKGKLFLKGDLNYVISSLNKKVWTCTIAKEQLYMYMGKYIITNNKTTKDGLELRIISNEAPSPFSKEEEITLEDVFAYYFKKEEVN